MSWPLYANIQDFDAVPGRAVMSPNRNQEQGKSSFCSESPCPAPTLSCRPCNRSILTHHPSSSSQVQTEYLWRCLQQPDFLSMGGNCTIHSSLCTGFQLGRTNSQLEAAMRRPSRQQQETHQQGALGSEDSKSKRGAGCWAAPEVTSLKPCLRYLPCVRVFQRMLPSHPAPHPFQPQGNELPVI